jgi:DNA-binding transcriptional ArsR family regulator
MNQNEVIKQYADEIPKEVRAVINGLSEDIRMAIIVGLLKNEKATFTDLKKLFDLKSSSLSYHLSLMQNGGLVDNIADLKESRSYYKATDIARLVLESLSDIVLGIITPRTRLKDLSVQTPADTRNTSGSYYIWKDAQDVWIVGSDDLHLPIQQHPSEDSSINLPQQEQSPSSIIPPPQTAAGIARRRIST